MIAVLTLAKIATIVLLAAILIVAMRLKGRGGDGS
jgi:hypothetical protein